MNVLEHRRVPVVQGTFAVRLVWRLLLHQTDKIVVASAEPWEQWFGISNKELRSTTATLQWLKRQLTGGFVDVVHETMAVISSPSKLQACDFIFPIGDVMTVLKPEEHQHREDEMMSRLAHACCGINGARLKRCGWMLLGWGSRSCFFTENDARGRAEVSRMQEEWRVWRAVQEKQITIEGLAEWIRRNPK